MSESTTAAELIRTEFRAATDALGAGEFDQDAVDQRIRPLFSRVLRRDEIYLANHSLGRPLDATADDIRAALDHWYADMDGAWGPWMQALHDYRALVAALIGCGRADAVVPKTSAGQGLRAVLNAIPVRDRPLRVLTTRGEFDSIDFILKTYAKKGRATIDWVEPDDRGRFDPDTIIAAINSGDPPDLVVVSQVVFASGQVIGAISGGDALDGLRRIVAAAHDRDARVLVDTYHAAGARTVGFDDLGSDFAIGGNYKYTRGGPGACWLAVRPDLLNDDAQPGPEGLFTLDTGWFAKKDTFGYERSDEPLLAPGGDAWLEATPPVLTAVQARAGLEFTLAMGVQRLRAFNLRKQSRLQEELAERGVPVADFGERGAFLCVPTEDPAELVAGLKSRGVSVDARPRPTGQNGGTTGLVRFCPDVLTTDDELSRAAEHTAEVMSSVAQNA